MDKQEDIYIEAINKFKSNNYEEASKLIEKFLYYNSKYHPAYNLYLI